MLQSSPPSSGANSPAKSFSPTHQAARSSERSSIVEDELEDDAFSPEDDALKERHHSGDSEDSALAISPPSAAAASSEVEPSSPSRFLVTPTKLDENNEPREPDFLPEIPQFSSYGLGQEFKGILKRRGQRCFSESQADGMTLSSWTGSDISSVTSDLDASLGSSKKSVRFNNTVQRQIFRPDSSILGQKRKNQKKSEQKKRKAERRASEGDVEEMMKMHETVPEEEEEEDEETDVHEDSGVEDVGGDKRDGGMLPGKSEGADTLKAKKKSKKSSGKKNSNSNTAAAGKKPMDAAPVPGQNGKHGFLSERTTDLIFDLDF